MSSKFTGRIRILVIIFFCILLVHPAHSQSRHVYDLGGVWDFSLSKVNIDGTVDPSLGWEKVNIPHTWNNKDIQSGEKVNYTTAWYRKTFIPEQGLEDKQYFLRFEGVGQYAKLFINSKYVGEHLGSYSAFAFNITDFLLADTFNTIHVKVNNELNDSYPKDNFLFGIYGGIYRDVSLIITGDIHIGVTDYASSGVYIHPKEVTDERAVLKIQSMLKNDGESKQLVHVSHKLYANSNKVIASSEDEEVLYPGGMISVYSALEIEQARLWNAKKDPFMYTLKTEVSVDGNTVDKLVHEYGIRYYDIDPEQGFILNGEPYRLYGVCRHQEWQDLGNALLPEHHYRDMELIAELGATSIRLAHYQQAEYIYELADRMGILVWAEIPFVNGYKEGADGNALQQITELIKQNYNHPSIFVWGVHNEVIKGDMIQAPVNLTRELHNLSKDLDPNRFTVAVSNIWWAHDHPIHENADLQGFNQYTGWYGGKPHELENWINNYHSKKPDIRFSVSEYGAGGNIAHQSDDIQTVPKPGGQFFPEGYQTYYHETTWNAIEKSPFIWASYVWNMYDFSVPEWDRGGIKGRNHKGLITYDRKTKKDAFYWYKANWSEEAVLHLSGKRLDQLSAGNIQLKAYCNFGIPEVFIDGESLGKMKQGINEAQYLKLIDMVEGDYRVEIRVDHKGKVYRDTFELRITEE